MGGVQPLDLLLDDGVLLRVRHRRSVPDRPYRSSGPRGPGGARHDPPRRRARSEWTNRSLPNRTNSTSPASEIERTRGRDGQDVAVVEAPNGEEMLPRLAATLGLDRSRAEPSRGAAVGDWFLTAAQRGNPRVDHGQRRAHRRVQGDTYFPPRRAPRHHDGR